MSDDQPVSAPGLDEPTTESWERRAPGWRFRCLKCGYARPFGKYGVRRGAASYRKCMLGWCPRCKGLHCHRVEKRPEIRDSGLGGSA